jgi:hypothetical protein
MKKTVQLQTQDKAGDISSVKMLEIHRSRIALFLARRPKVRTSQGSEEEDANWFL